MISSINLVSNNNNQLEKELRRIKAIRIIAVICLVSVALLSVLVFVVNYTLPLQAVRAQQQTELLSIGTMHKKLVTYTLLNDRVKNISDIIAKRTDAASLINTILGKLPTDLSVDSLAMENGTITLGISGSSLITMNQFIDSFIALKDNSKIINNISIQSLSLNVLEGKYSLMVQAGIL